VNVKQPPVIGGRKIKGGAKVGVGGEEGKRLSQRKRSRVTRRAKPKRPEKREEKKKIDTLVRPKKERVKPRWGENTKGGGGGVLLPAIMNEVSLT